MCLQKKVTKDLNAHSQLSSIKKDSVIENVQIETSEHGSFALRVKKCMQVLSCSNEMQ